MVETGYAEELEEHIKAAERLAQQGCQRLQQYFPKWKIQAAASPSEHASTAILDKANEWGADLIVAGTHGRSALGRVVLGSVSMKLVHTARCSVRIARARKPGAPLRLVVGDDGSNEGEAALAEVCRRAWPPDTKARVLAVQEILVTTNVDRMAADVALYDKINEDEHVRLSQIVERATEKLGQAGIKATPVLSEGDPKEAIINEARNWNASAIFVGARGKGLVERALLGSVSSAAVAHAPCTVEVVRSR
jgi:nucleotide-binding universal stress UspA family protein